MLAHCYGYYGRLIMGSIAIMATILPWVWFDGHPQAYSGSEIIAFTVAGEASEKWDMMKINFIGAFAILTLPIVIVGLNILASFRLYRNHLEIPLHITVIGLILLILLTVQSVTSNDQPTIGPFLFPSWGLAIILLTQCALIATKIPEARARQKQNDQQAQQYDWDPTV